MAGPASREVVPSRPALFRISSAATDPARRRLRNWGVTDIATAVTPTDQELLLRIAKRDEGALTQLYDRYCGAALAIATRVLGDRAEAEDVLQEVFVRVWDRAAEYDLSRGSVAAWVMSSIRNGAIDRLRRKDAFHRAVDGAAAQPRPEPEEREFPEDLKRVSAAVAKLPEEQRQAIELAYFEGLSQSEIASRLAQPLGTVKTRMRLAMQKLRAALAGFEEGAA